MENFQRYFLIACVFIMSYFLIIRWDPPGSSSSEISSIEEVSTYSQKEEFGFIDENIQKQSEEIISSSVSTSCVPSSIYEIDSNNWKISIDLEDGSLIKSELKKYPDELGSKSNKLMHTYTHTLNRNQLPDTFALDPIYTYKMVVHTVPEVVVNNIKLIPGKHNTIVAQTPQGILKLSTQGSNSQFTGINVIVRKDNEYKTINIHKMNSEKEYLLGKYDLEMLTLPRIYFEDVEIKPSKTTEITIPLYGSVQISKGNGPASLFLKENGQNIWLYDFDNFRYIENLNLQPGKYMISFRNSRSNSMAHTIIKEFKISSGQNLNLNL